MRPFFLAHSLALLICLPPAEVSRQTAKQEVPIGAARTGAISGVVTNGVGGQALSGVIVSLNGGGAQVQLRTVTDPKGRFVFRDLPPFDGYLIQAAKPGYVAAGLARRSFLLPETRVPLSEGEWMPDANIVMWRRGGISGTVVDEKGEPVVDVPVRVLTRIPIAGTTQVATGSAARTDDRGFYRIAGLRPGSYVVTVPSVQSVVPPSTPVEAVAGLSPASIALGPRQVPRVAGLDIGGSWLVTGHYATPPLFAARPQAYPNVFYPDARALSGASPVELGNGEERRGIDFTLRPVPVAQITGRVTGPAEVIKGLVIRLLPEGETFGIGFEQATALVGADGVFTLACVPAGQYTLQARTSVSRLATGGSGTYPASAIPATPGRVVTVSETAAYTIVSSAPDETLFGASYTTGHEAYSASLAVIVGDADVANVVLELRRGATISGRVVREDGAGLPNTVSVGVEPADGDPALGGSRSDRDVGRNSAGAFSIGGLQRGEYYVRVFAPGLVVKSITADGNYTDRPFAAEPGTDITNVLVTLTDRAAGLSGVVRDRQGIAVREAAVILFPVNRALWTRFGLDPRRIKRVTYFGSLGYRLAGIPAGEYYVIAVDAAKRDAWHDPRFFEAAAPLAARVTLDWGSSSQRDLTIQQVTVK